MRSSLIPGLLLLAASASALFTIKFNVQQVRNKLKEVKLNIVEEKKSMHVLNAELTYLSRPDSIKKIADQKLQLSIIKKEQSISRDTFNKIIQQKYQEKLAKELQVKIDAKQEGDG